MTPSEQEKLRRDLELDYPHTPISTPTEQESVDWPTEPTSKTCRWFWCGQEYIAEWADAELRLIKVRMLGSQNYWYLQECQPTHWECLTPRRLPAASACEECVKLHGLLSALEADCAKVTAERNFLEQNEATLWEVLKIPDGSTIHDVVATIASLTAERDAYREQASYVDKQRGQVVILQESLIAAQAEVERWKEKADHYEAQYELEFGKRCDDIERLTAQLTAARKEVEGWEKRWANTQTEINRRNLSHRAERPKYGDMHRNWHGGSMAALEAIRAYMDSLIATKPAETHTLFWLIERGQSVGQTPTLWWAGGDKWVQGVNLVPAEKRYKNKDHAQSAILIESHERCWPWQCTITEHSFMDSTAPAPVEQEKPERPPMLLAKWANNSECYDWFVRCGDEWWLIPSDLFTTNSDGLRDIDRIRSDAAAVELYEQDLAAQAPEGKE